MMHYDGTIITVRTLPKGNVVREYQHTRSGNKSHATVLLDYNTEFALGFKFTEFGRRRLELWIDGAMVTDSLIINSETVLERFVDSARKFKFVRPDHKDVADPTSKDNGGVVIKLWKEKPQFVWVNPVVLNDPWQNPQPRNPWPGMDDNKRFMAQNAGSGRGSSLGSPLRGMDMGTGHIQCSADSSVFTSHAGALCSDTFSSDQINLSCNVSNASLGSAGATVEGGKSNQHIGTTTWNGDLTVEPLEFTFQLRGREKNVHTPGICQTCGNENHVSAKFCSECGTSMKHTSANVAGALTR